MLMRRLQRPTVLRISGVVLAVVGCAVAVGEIATRSAFPWLRFQACSSTRRTDGSRKLRPSRSPSTTFTGSTWCSSMSAGRCWSTALLGAAFSGLCVNPPWKIAAQHYSGGQWLFMVLFSITSMLIPFSLYFAGLQHLDATRAIVTACLEPVWAILLTATVSGRLVSPIRYWESVLCLQRRS